MPKGTGNIGGPEGGIVMKERRAGSAAAKPVDGAATAPKPVDVMDMVRKQNIPIIDLYFDRGDGTRYRSLGCAPCTFPIKSTAKTLDEIIEELRRTTVAERAGRAQDEGRGMETLRKDGYM